MAKPKRKLFDPNSSEPFKLSRSKLEDFVRCQRCFYLDRRLGVAKPSIPAFTLNSAVDQLLKSEFDHYRAKARAHPLMKAYGIKAVPFQHQDLDRWRFNFHGVRYWHRQSNCLIYGAVDDLWINQAGELMVVDYKSTSMSGEVSLKGRWKESYKRQIEVYQWLLRRNGFRVSDTGFFVYANGQAARPKFNRRLEFDLRILPYQADDSWVEPTIIKAKACLMSDLPDYSPDCEHCHYQQLAGAIEPRLNLVTF